MQPNGSVLANNSDPGRTDVPAPRLRRVGGIPLRAFVPNAITALALCCGLSGVRAALASEWDVALLLIIGAGEGKLEMPLMGALAGKGASICSFVGGTAEDTRSAISLAEQGLLRNDIEFFDIADSAKAFEKLAAGQLAGRAVIVPS